MKSGRWKGLSSILSLLCVILDLHLDGVLAATHVEIEQHLEMGRKLFAAGQLAEALSHYHSAVEGDSKNSLAYYKRATVFLAMGKSKSALSDLTRAIQHKQHFLAARLQRGNILLKLGNIQEARKGVRAVLQHSPDQEEAQDQLLRANELEELREEAHAGHHRGDYSTTISVLDRVIELSPWDPDMWELRAECYMHLGEPRKAIQDLTPAARLRNDNRAAFLKLSMLHYRLGEHQESLNHVRECLKLDQDDKECSSHYKLVKKLSKESTHVEIEQHLEMGRKLFAAGQLAEALSHYHSAVEGDSKNYLVYYKRATVFLAMGKSKSALSDLTRAIQHEQDFLAARLQRGNILLKLGNIQEARKGVRAVLQRSPDQEEAQDQLLRANELEELREEAHAAHHRGDYSITISVLDRVIELSPWDPDMWEFRAECYDRLGDLLKAIQDLTPTTRLRNDNRAAFLKLSMLHYRLGEHQNSLNHVRECLKLDQDDKECFSHYKLVKKLSKQLDVAEELIHEQRYRKAIDKYESVMRTEPNIPFYTNLAKERICYCLVKNKIVSKAIDVCSEAHQIDSRNVNILRDRAEAFIMNQDYEKAVEDYQEAREFDGKNTEIREGLERAQKLLKVSQRGREKDYYKILDINRNANKQEIIKAYRKLAQQWHPDNFQSEYDKLLAEKRFIDIASAKEVLTNPEMRRKFDAGKDPYSH